MSYQRNGALLGSKFREYLFPTIISNMSILLASFVDGIIVSKLINDDAFSAVNLAEPVVLFMQALFFLFGIGGAICISIAKGQRDEHKANAVFTLSFIAAIVVSVIVTVVGIVLIDPITHLLCNNNTLFDYVRNYALFNIYGAVFMIVVPYLVFIVRTDGMPKLSANILLVSNVVNLLTSVVVVVLLLLLYFNLDALHQPEELLPLMRPYFLVLLVSLPFLALFNSMKQFSDAVGDTKTPMWVMIGSNVVNLVLNYVCIFLLDWGLLGAGVATLLSRVMMPVALHLALKYGALLQSEQFLQAEAYSEHPSKGRWLLVRLGIPISVQMCLEAGSFNVCALFMGWIGATALAAHQVMCTVSTVGFMVYYGVGAAAAIRIAYFRGQDEWDEVQRTARTAFWMSVLAAVVITSTILLAGVSIARMFTTSPEVTLLFLALLPAFACYQLGDCLQTIYANSLRAIQDVRPMMISAFVAYALVSIPLAWLLAFPCGMGAVGVWWSFPFGLTTAGLLYQLRFRWKTNRIIIQNQ